MDKNLFVHKHTSILDTLKQINSNLKGIAIVVDEENKLLGTVTDGDIRRGLISGISLDCGIEGIYNKNCKYVFVNYVEQDLNEYYVNQKIRVVPVVNEEMEVVEIIDIENKRSTKIQVKHDTTERDNPVLIMAGGLGTRLRPLTDNIPKPMLKIGDKPILEIIIDQFKNKGYKNILLSVNYKAEVIEDYFKDGKDFGVNIRYIRENKRMGTAGAIKLAEEYLDKPFFVINGDIITTVNVENFIEYHHENDFTMTIGSRVYDMQVPYGVLNMDEICVSSLEEKPTVSFYVSAGVYALNPEVLEFIPKDEFFDITELINILTSQKYRVGSFPILEYWKDIGRLDDYNKANEDMKNMLKDS